MIEIMDWMYVLVFIDKNVYQLSINLNITYAHIVKLVTEMEKRGWLIKEKKGRVNYITLTEEGIKMKKLCQPLVKEFKRNKRRLNV